MEKKPFPMLSFMYGKKIQKKYKTREKKLAIWKNFYYTNKCCDMIAVKREVAAFVAGFPWSECQVRKLTTSHCITSRDLPRIGGGVCSLEMTHTGMCTVAACRTTKSAKRRRLFFMASQVMRITLKAYDHQLVDASCRQNYRNC